MEHIGKYRIVRLIGSGGMGRVYEAVDPLIGRRVAVKTLSLNIVNDFEAHSRFFREAQAAGQLSHPHLITIFDTGEADGHPYLVMEYLEGEDLSRVIAGRPLSLSEKLQLMIQMCHGLGYAHGHGVVHRDIKPANIFLTAQGIKILDFGLARGAVSEVTQTGRVLGTPNYMAPEQIRGESTDHRSDIFALGVVFYELLSGRKAFEGDSVAATIYKVLEFQPEPVHHWDATLPIALSALVSRALAKDRNVRYQRVDEMLADITRIKTQLDAEPASVRPTAAFAAVPRKTSLRAIALAAAAAVVVAVAVAAFLMSSRRGSEPSQSGPPIAASSTGPATPSPSTEPAATASSPSPSPSSVPLPSASSPPSQATSTPPAPAAPAPSVPEPRSTPPASRTPPADAASRRQTPSAPPASTPAPRPETQQPAVAQLPPARPEPAPPDPPVVAPPPRQPEHPQPDPAHAAPPPSVVPPSPTVAAPPLPAPAAPAAPAENPTAAVQETLGRYRAAMEARSIAALKQVWPALSGRQEMATRSEFDNARAIAVDLRNVTVQVAGTTATVNCRRNYVVTTLDNRTLQSTTRMIVTMERHNGSWVIDAIRHEADR